MRNRDNFKNSYDYIINQLFPYDYNNSEHVHILKLKLWTLDAEPLQEEIDAGFTDTDINHPKDHKSSLSNELVFLDRYRKTEDELLGEHEVPFDKLVAQRIKSLEMWTSRPDPLTGEMRPAYTMPYMSRPTLLTTEQFRDLYLRYKVKEKEGQLSNCLEITTKVTSDDINLTAEYQEKAILNYKQPPEQKTMMGEEAAKMKANQDDDLVYEMDKAYSEIRDILASCAPAPFVPTDAGTKTSTSGSAESGTTTTTITISYSDIGTLGLNFPSPREYISLTPNDPSHKGYIEEEVFHTGGYRFSAWNESLTSRVGMPTVYEGFPPDWQVSVSPYKIGNVEWNFDDFLFAHKYTRTVTITTTTTSPSTDPDSSSSYKLARDADSGSSSETTSTSTTYVVPTLKSSSGDRWANIANSAKDASKKAEASKISARMKELTSRWYDFNEIRENQIRQTGLRLQIESLLDTEPESVLDDMKHYFEVLKSEEDNVEDILVERCLFGEWK